MPDYLMQLAREYEAQAEAYSAILCIVNARPIPNRQAWDRYGEDLTSARVNALTYSSLASRTWGYVYQCEQTEKNKQNVTEQVTLLHSKLSFPNS